jgi:hypothetical protein
MEEKRDGAKWRGEERVERGETCENSGQEEKVLGRKTRRRRKKVETERKKGRKRNAEKDGRNRGDGGKEEKERDEEGEGETEDEKERRRKTEERDEVRQKMGETYCMRTVRRVKKRRALFCSNYF